MIVQLWGIDLGSNHLPQTFVKIAHHTSPATANLHSQVYE
jgi:hypothetical protein